MALTETFSEEELVSALKMRSQKAFGYLYAQYGAAIFTFIKQVIPANETAEDVLQETFTGIWKNIDKYDPSKGRLFTWLVRLARNQAIDTTRSKLYKSGNKNVPLENYVDYFEQTRALHQPVDSIGLRKHVGLLQAEQREVIELCYFNGFTNEEAAKILKLPAGTVKSRLRTALIELRKRLIEP
ncbi:MAG: sigma-70 family RNA polymerase sigma factor [Ferruginibacter sp.]